MYDGEIGRAHADALRAVARSEREELERQESAAEARGWALAAAAGPYHERMELARAQVEAAAAREARAEREERDRRTAAAEDYRAMLLATGQGRWRSVSEILASQAGWG
jgi:hypothetical protein